MFEQTPKTFGRFGATLVLGAALLAGCQEQKQPKPTEDPFFAGGRERVEAVSHAQAKAGARQDAMLNEVHFQGDALNTLGQEKLKLMLPDAEDPTPVVVYLNVPASEARTKVVSDYLLDQGLTAEQFRVETGANPGAWHPTQDDIRRLDKTESPGQDTGSGGSSTMNP